MLRRLTPVLLLLVTLMATSEVGRAQQMFDLSGVPMIEGPGTQGFLVYRGPAIPNFFWFCDETGGVFNSIGEIAEEVHMLQAGDLASFSFAYYVNGGSVASSGTATAIVKFYANDPTDSVTPPTGLIATYTIPNLPWDTSAAFSHTFDVPSPLPVPKDLWVGFEIVTPLGTAGSLLGASPQFSPPQSSAPNLGSSHNVTWFGPSSCTVPPGELLDNATAFGITVNYTIAVRIFPAVECDYAIPNGDFEDGTLIPWSGAGRRGVLTAEQSSTVPPSGAYQGFVDNGLMYPTTGSPALPPLLELTLGVPSGTLAALAATLPGSGSVTHGSVLTQTLTAAAGDVLEFKWNFQTNEPTPSLARNDFAFLTITSAGSVVLADTFFPTFVTSPSPFNEETEYQSYSHSFASAGSYTIGFGVVDRGTATTDSALLIDCVELVPGAPTNQAPSCSADFTVARMDFLEVAPGAFVVTEGTTISVPFEGIDPDGDPLQVSTSGLPFGALVAPTSGPSPLVTTFQWTPTAADKAGAPYTIVVTFSDPDGAPSSCEVTIADVNLNPICSASDQTLECTSHDGVSVTLDGSATDADDPAANLIYQWFVSDQSVVLDDPSSPTPTGTFPVGVTMATLSVADGRGGIAVCDVLITVQDTTPPEVQCTTNIAVLWPPKHVMVPVTLVVTATDACMDPSEILPIAVTVSSNEPDDAQGGGDGHTLGDVNGMDGYTSPVDVTASFAYDLSSGQWTGIVHLRAERQGAGNGRKYTLDVIATDSSGNPQAASCCVIVPHDRRPCQ